MALRGNEELLEVLNTLFLVDSEAAPEGRRAGGPAVLSRTSTRRSARFRSETLIQVNVDQRQDRVIEFFDKYNLLTLPVVDEEGKLAGVITADDIISVLRRK